MSVGIIGGADGPTAIFLASSVNWLFVCALGIVVLSVALFFLFRKRKKS
jgi:Na+-transporting methylmalonyl-CoA/oxaloacetate decarboxylase beta subunit